jgi:hypothetical protein
MHKQAEERCASTFYLEDAHTMAEIPNQPKTVPAIVIPLETIILYHFHQNSSDILTEEDCIYMLRKGFLLPFSRPL